jgi:2-phosphosulfolactate phosphatase
MTLDVAFSPYELAPGEVAGRTVVVLDVLRTTTTICAALHHGARAVIIAEDAGEASRIAQAVDPHRALLAGERHGVRIDGFDLGNSPREMTAEAVAGKTVVLTTTNGTAALLATAGARDVLVGAAVNFSGVASHVRAAYQRDGDLLIVCAGRDHGFGLDDAYLAGRVAIAALGGPRHRKGLNDAALAALALATHYGGAVERIFAFSSAGRQLRDLGFHDDILVAATVDAFPVLPRYHDRRVTLAVPELPSAA